MIHITLQLYGYCPYANELSLSITKCERSTLNMDQFRKDLKDNNLPDFVFGSVILQVISKTCNEYWSASCVNRDTSGYNYENTRLLSTIYHELSICT